MIQDTPGARVVRPLTDPRTAGALAYLVIGVVAAACFFVVVNVVGWVAFGLLWVLVGLALVVPAFAAVDACVAARLAMAKWVGRDIESLDPVPLPGRGLRAAWRAVRDPRRWRRVGFLLIDPVLAAVFVAVGLAPLALLLLVIFGVGGVALGVVVVATSAVATPHTLQFAAGLKADVDAWFLGPDRVAMAEARAAALTVQRQEILDAVAAERRRIERNLHDGVQQQLVAIGLDLAMADGHLGDDPDRAHALLGQAREKVQGSIGELRQLGRGLHPAILADRGLDAALSAVVANTPIPIAVEVDPALALSTDVAETIYFVVNEAVANVLKHADARVASVRVHRADGVVHLVVHDDGRGGARMGAGTGLTGMRARVEGHDGTLVVSSPVGGPTVLEVALPDG